MKILIFSFTLLFAMNSLAQTVIVPSGSNWKYLDDGSDQGSNWYSTEFNDDSWSSGSAEFGYGDNDEATLVGFGSNADNKYPTTYFRKSFNVNDPAVYNDVRLEAIRDDGLVVYLNGSQVWSDNMPQSFNYQTYASNGIGGSDETAWISTVIRNSLVAGTNILAVEIHQSSVSSSDMSFDFKLIGGVNDAPTVEDMSISAVENSSVDFYLSATDDDGDSITFAVSSPSNGNVSLYGNTVTYIPNADFRGTDSFSYTATDGKLSSDATVNITLVDPVSDEALMTQVQKDVLKYFWDYSHPSAKLTKERIHIDNLELHKDMVTSGGSGFGLLNVIMGIENNYINRDEALSHLENALEFLENADRFHGAWPHWMHGDTGEVWPFSDVDDGGDLVETAFLAQGLICLREYFKDGSERERLIAAKADELWRSVEWSWYTKGEDKLYWHWSPNYQWEINLPVSGYNEALITYVLAASSPTHPIEASAYHNGWAGTDQYHPDGWIKIDAQKYGIPVILKHGGAVGSVGPMFLSHYSNMVLDPRSLKDTYADNYLDVVTNHAKVIYEHSVRNPNNYQGYSERVWGLTASYSYDLSKEDNTGYHVHQPDDDLGVITPTAALSSLPYTPTESLRFLRYLYEGSNKDYLSAAGPIDAFSIHHQWKPKRYLAIDQGTIGPMIENHKTQLFWKLFMNAPEIRDGLFKLGFSSIEHGIGDDDQDAISNDDDNCPSLANTDQADTDSDGLGDACDAFPDNAAETTDTDGDGVGDNADVFPSNAAESTDTDGDGVGDNADAFPSNASETTDTDGDGVGDNADAFPTNASETTDTDGDGVGDNADAFPSNAAETTDTDGDGVGDNADAFPNDATNSDNTETVDDSNTEEANNVDSVAPELTIPANKAVNSTGPLTIVDLGVATAVDDTDGNILPSADKTGPFSPGRHTITWTASDQAGNSATDGQTIDVIPMVSFAASQSIREGAEATIQLSLNGQAVSYPVVIPFIVGGTAESLSDHNLVDGEVSIESGTTASITLASVEDDTNEGDESIVISMGALTNAVIGTVSTHTITLKEVNSPPTVNITLQQAGEPVTTVYIDKGEVVLTALVTDPDPNDVHSYSWSVNSYALNQIEDSTSSSFTFDPSSLPEGFFIIAVTVSDNGNDPLTSSSDIIVRIDANTPQLSDSADSDGDGISDTDEGANDSDLDRIPNYLDSVEAPNHLPANESGTIIQSDVGLQLILGETAFAAGKVNAAVTLEEVVEHGGTGGGFGANVENENIQFTAGIFDFEVLGAEAGESIRIVLPQLAAIPGNAIYRKYFSGVGWSDFVIDGRNTIASAPGALGVCPSPGDQSYVTGLTEGYFCVHLTIEDGGPNDTDGLANGIVKDPGGVSVGIIPEPLITTSNTALRKTAFNTGDGEEVVMAFILTTDSTDAEVSELAFAASGEMNEASDISGVRLYRDENSNGIPEVTERIADGSYDADNGEIRFTLSDAIQLPVGDTQFLVTYQF